MTKTQKEEGVLVVSEGQVYKEKDGGREVIPFFVDLHNSRTRFSQLGRSGEEEMSNDEFLDKFELVGPLSSQAEKVVEKK